MSSLYLEEEEGDRCYYPNRLGEDIGERGTLQRETRRRGDLRKRTPEVEELVLLRRVGGAVLEPWDKENAPKMKEGKVAAKERRPRFQACIYYLK